MNQSDMMETEEYLLNHGGMPCSNREKARTVNDVDFIDKYGGIKSEDNRTYAVYQNGTFLEIAK